MEIVQNVQEQFINGNIKIRNVKLNQSLIDYSFYYITKKEEIENNQLISERLKETKVIIIDQYEAKNQSDIFLIIGFKKTIIIINKLFLPNLIPFFSEHYGIPIYFISDLKQNFNIDIHNEKLHCDNRILIEISRFNQEFSIIKILDMSINKKNLINIWKIIQSCISGYLIIQAHNKIKEKQSYIHITKNEEISISNFSENEFITLRLLGTGCLSQVQLIYHIEKEELFAMKKPIYDSDESIRLYKREKKNYSNINFPLLPKFYGTAVIRNKKHFIIQFIDGQTLMNINDIDLNFDEKIKIILEIMMIINYLHKQKFVYRDLKPDNVIIDDNKNAFIIDFDRMVKIDDELEDIQTADFASEFVAPEVNKLEISYKNDIYSIGKLIHYIINQEKNEHNYQIQKICDKCLNICPEERPDISTLMNDFISYFPIYLESVIFQNDDPEALFNLGNIYFKEDINKSIYYYSLAADKNHTEALFSLGFLYEKGKYIKQDINKAIHYYTLAANQNCPDAQFILGFLYKEGKYIKQDINKSIHYYTLAANQNYLDAQFNLAVIYYKGDYITQNINKAVHYLILAANKDHSQSQYSLGSIYLEGKYITRDINKAAHYLALAANQNHAGAQYSLGLIYMNGKYIKRDINKSIYYYTLAANQNHRYAQFNLGLIYQSSKYTTQDINKSIYYYTLAANQNDLHAQCNLAKIYLEGKYIARDINKAIYYYSLAANQNEIKAQYSLGAIYYEGKYIKQDLNQSIYYLSLAAKQNHLKAQFCLGVIYSENKYGKLDIDKSIYYLSLAAKQNHPLAQFRLGVIYYEGKYVTRDINKSIYYLTLAAKQNHSTAQYNLGVIYSDDILIKQNINKAIHYYSLSANQNYPDAQFCLANLYYDGKYITRDINKAIYYYSLAANQNHPDAQFILSKIYYDGKYIKQDINKSIYYLQFASKQNHSDAQYVLGLIYLRGLLKEKNIYKGIDYLIQSSSNGNIEAHFAVGYFYNEGKYVDKDNKKAIHHYKEASSFNDECAKNNLGIIYKHGFENDIMPNIGMAIEYFEEAIKQKDDPISMYNLSHIFIYDDPTKEKIDKSIELLIKSSNHYFNFSNYLLCIALIKKHGKDIEKIREDLINRTNTNDLTSIICQMIDNQKLLNNLSFDEKYEQLKKIDFIYNFDKFIIPSSVLYEKKLNKKIDANNKNMKNITFDFYQGFGIQI